VSSFIWIPFARHLTGEMPNPVTIDKPDVSLARAFSRESCGNPRPDATLKAYAFQRHPLL
jgi:hypothetical protein